MLTDHIGLPASSSILTALQFLEADLRKLTSPSLSMMRLIAAASLSSMPTLLKEIVSLLISSCAHISARKLPPSENTPSHQPMSTMPSLSLLKRIVCLDRSGTGYLGCGTMAMVLTF